MKNIIHIFKDDLKGLTTNFLALIIAGGLCVLPSLYAWFNIYSNWDPYANTQNVPIAIASDDLGYEKDDGTYVNMGDEVLEKLRDNDKLGWTFTQSTKDAIDGVYSGEYYAALVLGEDFSESMYNCLANNMEHPKIYYYENEKRNAIAVKITDSGSSTLQNNINTEFINVVVTTLSENIDTMSDGKSESLVADIENKIKRVNDNLKSYDELMDSFIECNNTLSETVLSMKDVLPKLNNALNSGLGTMSTIKNETNKTAAAANTLVGTKLNEMAVKVTVANNLINVAQTQVTTEGGDKATAAENLNSASANLGSISSDAKEISAELDKLKGLGYDSQIDSAKKKLEAVEKTAAAAQKATSKAATATTKGTAIGGKLTELEKKVVSDAMDEAVAQLPGINQKIYGEISSEINGIAKEVNKSVGSASSALYTGKGDIDTLDTVFDGISLALLAGNEAILNSRTVLDGAIEKLTGIIDQLDGLSDGEKYQKLMDIIHNDPSLYGDFLSQPVTVITEPVYETTTYGSAVTPFYTTLALWVGGILLVSLFKVKAKPKNDYKDATEAELFFGRYLLFFILGQIQAVICVFGDIHLLKVQCHEPELLYLIGSVASFTFTLLIYTLTISFGDVGKALVVVVMVIQIAGSSGTYPIELLPDIFQKIYVYFPFPYSINAMRETISGMYLNDYWVYMGQLLIFAFASLIVGLFIRIPFMGINHFLEKRMEDTEMM